MAAAAPPNIARINGPLSEHTRGNLLNARSRAEIRIRDGVGNAGTRAANRRLADAITRHLTARNNRTLHIDAEARERRLVAAAARNAAANAPFIGPSLPPIRIPESSVGPYYTSQYKERGTWPLQRRTRRRTRRRTTTRRRRQ